MAGMQLKAADNGIDNFKKKRSSRVAPTAAEREHQRPPVPRMLGHDQQLPQRGIVGVLHRRGAQEVSLKGARSMTEEQPSDLEVKRAAQERRLPANNMQRRVAVHVKRIRICSVPQQQGDGWHAASLCGVEQRGVEGARVPRDAVWSRGVLQEELGHQVAWVPCRQRGLHSKMHRPSPVAVSVDILSVAATEQQLQRPDVVAAHCLEDTMVFPTAAAATKRQVEQWQRPLRQGSLNVAL